MAIPDMERLRASWRTQPERARLGLVPERIDEDSAVYTVDLRYGDGREDDPLYTSAAVTFAADVAATSAVRGRLDETKQQLNGTISLHLNFLAPLAGFITIETRVVSMGEQDSVIDIVGHDDRGTTVLKGIVDYSLRPRAAREERRG